MKDNWILCSDKMPDVIYNPEMDYWYSRPVLTDNGYRLEVRVAKSADGKSIGWGSSIGGEPNRWREVD